MRVASLPRSREALIAAVDSGRTFRYRFFWGHTPRPDGKLSDSVFSQWWRCDFSDGDGDGAQRYSSAEQYMMAGKARLFGDQAMLAQILETHEPAAVKALGRQVQGFDEARWAAARLELVTRGNVCKFALDPLRAYLLSTGDEILVEAAPRDRIWGIGLGRDSAGAKDPRTWRGQNLLGFALVGARASLSG